MNILIFGSEGNIGSSLVKNFLKKTKGNIYIVDVNKKSVHKNERIKYLSFNNKRFNKTIISKTVDLVVIASFIMNYQNYINGKEKIYLNKSERLIEKILDFCSKIKIKRLIYLSSIAVYGKTNYCTEKSRLKPATIYGLAKLNSENIIKKKISIKSKYKYLILRLTHIYGENIKNNFVNFFLKNKNNLLINGNGKQTRNLLHVDDLFSLIKKTKSLKINSTINVASKENISLNKIIKLIKGKAKYNNNFKDSYPDEVSYEKARKLLSWSPRKKFIRYLKRYI